MNVVNTAARAVSVVCLSVVNILCFAVRAVYSSVVNILCLVVRDVCPWAVYIFYIVKGVGSVLAVILLYKALKAVLMAIDNIVCRIAMALTGHA